jgi:Lipopolysaccharide-assembly
MTPSGAVRSARWLLAALPILWLSGCLYGFSGGGGLPKNLRSVAVQPFDNLTASSEVQRELLDETRKGMRDRLNLREATEQKADVVVRGTIVRYEVDLPAGVSADPRQTTSTRRRLQLVVDIEIIDQTTQRTLFEKKALTTEGQYPEGGETAGRRLAIESFISQVIEGMQSQW